MPPSPRVHVVVPAYQSESTLPHTLASLTAQTFRGLEITVVDNASTDATAQVAEDVPGVEVVREPVHVGLFRNLERCIARSQGEFTAIFHADDVYDPTIVARQVAFLDEHPEAGAVLTWTRQVDAAGHPLPRRRQRPNFEQILGPRDRVLGFEEVLPLLMRWGNFLMTPSATGRTDVYRSVGAFDDDRFAAAADVDWWLRLARHHAIGIIAMPLVAIRNSRTQGSFLYETSRTGRSGFLAAIDAHVASSTFIQPGDRASFRVREVRDDLKVRANAVARGVAPDGDRPASPSLGMADVRRQPGTALLMVAGLAIRAAERLMHFPSVRALARRLVSERQWSPARGRHEKARR